MKIGVCVSNFFFWKVTGNPMHDAVYENGALKEMRYLSITELKRTTGNVLEYVANLGIEAIEVYQTLERFEAMLSSLKDRGNMELILHECNAELWYPGSKRISSRNPQVRKVVTENLNWLIDMAGEVRARAVVLHPASFDNTAQIGAEEGFGSENIFGFEEARHLEIELLRECSERAHEQGIILALEDSEPQSLEASKGDLSRTAREFAVLIDEVNRESVQCTFDVGHADVGFSAIEYAKILGKKIAHVHLHDCDGEKPHLRLGEGRIDLETLFKVFTEIEEERGDEITVVLENEGSAGAGYEEEWEKLKSLKAACT